MFFDAVCLITQSKILSIIENYMLDLFFAVKLLRQVTWIAIVKLGHFYLMINQNSGMSNWSTNILKKLWSKQTYKDWI